MAHDASDGDSWVDLNPDSDRHIGAYFPDGKDGQPETMTVFWKGELSSDNIRNILRSTEILYDGSANYQAIMTLYGEERKEITSVGGSLVDRLSHVIDALRAEFSGSIGDLTLWATLSPASEDGLKDTSENIGVCVSPSFFGEGAKTLIAYAIRETVDDAEQIIDASLGRLSDLIRRDLGSAVAMM